MQSTTTRSTLVPRALSTSAQDDKLRTKVRRNPDSVSILAFFLFIPLFPPSLVIYTITNTCFLDTLSHKGKI